jgi:hypothetical protein
MFEYILGFCALYIGFTKYGQLHQKMATSQSRPERKKQVDNFTEAVRDDSEHNAVLFNGDPTTINENTIPGLGVHQMADDLQYDGPSTDFNSQYNANEQLRPMWGRQLTNPPVIAPTAYDTI